MKNLTVKHLEKLKACSSQVELFRKTFGESVEFNSLKETKQIAKKYAQEFDFHWIGERVFGEAYQEAREPLYEAYEEVIEPLLKAYQEAEEPLWKAYLEAEEPLWKAYQEAGEPLYKAYLEAEEPLYKAYEEAIEPYWKAYEEARAETFAEMWWGIEKVDF